MSVAAPASAAAAPAEDLGATRADDAPVHRSTRPRRVLAACVALLALYGLLSLFNDARGSLGTDTGGKLASLAAMDRNDGFNPDLGYWAESFDPEGALHPLTYTPNIHGKWVNLTTLPMAYAAYPLYEIGGIRAALLLPMLGGVLAALAARALARRFADERAGWYAFWLVGLATPIAVYALDFWEHSLGVAAVLWAAVLAHDVANGRAGVRAAVGAGLLLGLAATLRTEALVYGVVLGAVVLVQLIRRRATLGAIFAYGVASGAAAGAVLVVNDLLEQVTIGESLRAGRTADVAASAAGAASERANEALTTLIGINRFVFRTDVLVGAILVACVAYGAWKVMTAQASERRLGIGLLVVAGVLYAAITADQLGFVPGMLTASVLAVAGLVAGARDRKPGPLLVWAIVSLPLVWVFQYAGGGRPQWGGRYVLVSGVVLAVVAAAAVASAPRAARILLGGLALAVTLTGVAHLGQRSHVLADGMRSLEGHPADVLISQEAHVLREGGAFYSPDHHWLTAVGDRELREAFRVAGRSGAETVALVGAEGRDRPAQIAGFQRGASEELELLPRFKIRITTYERSES